MLCCYKFIAKIAKALEKEKNVGKLLVSKKTHEAKRNSSFDWKNSKHQETFILMSCLEVLIGIEIYALPKFILSPYFSLFPELVLMGIEVLSFRTVVFHLALVKKKEKEKYTSPGKNSVSHKL